MEVHNIKASETDKKNRVLIRENDRKVFFY